MVGHFAVEPQATEPAICQIEVNLLAKPPLGADAEAIADQQHPDHQLGINRGPTQLAVERSELAAHPAQVNEAVDRAQQMSNRNVPLQRELIEQRSLFDLSSH